MKAARALLSHQDKLRQILCQPAVVDIATNTGGMVSSGQSYCPDLFLSLSFIIEKIFLQIIQHIFNLCVCFFYFFIMTLYRGPSGDIS